MRSRAHEIQEDWKPSFLSNEEFTHLTLEAVDGFIMLFSSSGRIYYASESITSLLGYLPSELTNSTIYEIALQEDQSHLYNTLANASNTRDQSSIKTGTLIYYYILHKIMKRNILYSTTSIKKSFRTSSIFYMPYKKRRFGLQGRAYL